MAKFKPAGSSPKKKASAKDNRVLIPCAFLLLLGFALIFWLLYLMLTSGK